MSNAIVFYSAQIGKSCRKLEALSQRGLKSVCSGNDTIARGVNLIFRWGCTGRTGMNDAKFVNTTKAIEWCCDKRGARLAMQAAGVPVPETWTTEEFAIVASDADRGILSSQKFVARPEHHTQGKQMHVGTALQLAWNQQFFPGGYISRFIDRVAEYRVFVVSNRVAWVNRTEDPGDGRMAWNYADGDNVYWGDWPAKVVTAALAAAKVSGTDFCAVDLMVDADGNAYVSEVNTAPGQEGTYHPSCVAKCFDYIIANGKEKFADPVVPEGTPADRAWRWYIHPAVSEQANAVHSRAA